ncbi:Bug family tripartite tricarboxylate transporter substrate binding protein [Hydrogenophaga sp. OTU3427]|uniref:Bug family tripartite tricarboxylate transporter substrate binding protein n=1 Tax=Hydrogenophaga sp. OTU3427 TaxID=3043856 RepID=UPI00313AA15C
MTLITRRSCLGAMALAPLIGQAQATSPFPHKVIRLVVPYPPGGGNDVLARGLKTHWERAWGQAVVVDNKPGGNGTLGTEIVAKAPGDGYTVLMGSIATHVISPLMKRKSGRYDPVKEFTPLAMAGSTPLILTVHPSVKANNLREFVALAKATREGVSYASVGNGSAGHLAGAMFEQMAGVEMMHVPYKGISQATTELVGGVVNAAFSNVLNVLPLIRTGKLRALGVTGTQSLSILPDVPPISQVLPGYSSELWWGLFGPAGIPPDVVRKFNEESNRYLESAEARKRWAEEGITLNPMSQQDFVQQIARDTVRWGDLITTRKITEES